MTRTQAAHFFKYTSLAGIYGGLLMPLVFIPVVIFPFVFSKLIFFQILIGLTFPAYIALAWMEPKFRPKKHILYFGILAYFASILLSVIFAVDPYRAWWGNQERMNGLFTLLHFLAWLTMAVGLLKTWKDWRRLLNYQIVLSGIMALVAIMQKFNPDLLLYTAGRRVGGLLDNPIYMAAYQIFNIFFLALLAWKVKDRRWWFLYGGAAFLDILAFIFTESRGGLLGLGIGIVAFTIFIGMFHTKKTVKVSIFSIVALLMTAYGFIFVFRGSELISNSPLRRFTDLTDTLETRLIAWDIAWDGFLERPLTGWGFDNFHILFNEKYNPESLRYGQYETWFDRAHNTVLDVLSMTGLVGFLTYVFIYVAIFYSVIRAYKKEWIDLPIAAILFSLPLAYFFQNLLVFDHPAGFSMSFLMYGLIIGATSGEFVGAKEAGDQDMGKIKSKMHSAPWTSFAVFQIAALILVWRVSVLPFQMSKLSIASNNIINTNFDRALDMAEEANRTWTPYTDEQSFVVSRNLVTLVTRPGFSDLPRWREAYDFAKEMNEREYTLHPRNTNTLFVYARLLHAFGQLAPEDIARSEQLYLAAITTSKKRQQIHYALARLYTETGNMDATIEILRNVKDFDYELGEGHWRYGVALLYDKHELEEGAKEIALSQSVQYRFKFTDGRELVPLFDAYLILGDTEAMDRMISKLDTYPKADESVYAQFIAKLSISNMPEQQAAVEAFAKEKYPDIDKTVLKVLQDYASQNGGTELAQ